MCICVRVGVAPAPPADVESHRALRESRPPRPMPPMRLALLLLCGVAVRAAPHCPHECPAASRMPGGFTDFDCSNIANRHCGSCLACLHGTCT